MTEPAVVEALTEAAREHLATITKGWRYVLDPIDTPASGTTRNRPRPATEDEADQQIPPDARLDTPRDLAFWVHAAIDEWPTILQTLQPDEHGHLQLVTTETINCSDVYAMADLLHREAGRIAAWVEGPYDYGATFVAELSKLARAVARVAWPPPADRLVIGDCPACDRLLRVKAPTWRQQRSPQPTTDPDTYPAWITLPDAAWEPVRDRPIACRCGKEDTFEGWRQALAGPTLLLTSEELVKDIREQFGLKYQPLTVRTWARRGLIRTAGYRGGRAVYDRTQVLAALMARERAALDERTA